MLRKSEILEGTVTTAAVTVGTVAAIALSLFLYKTFAPQFENARRNVFENTQSYNDGMKQQLQQYYLEYQKADKDEKTVIRDAIAHQYASYPLERLPAHLQTFASSILNPIY